MKKQKSAKEGCVDACPAQIQMSFENSDSRKTKSSKSAKVIDIKVYDEILFQKHVENVMKNPPRF